MEVRAVVSLLSLCLAVGPSLPIPIKLGNTEVSFPAELSLLAEWQSPSDLNAVGKTAEEPCTTPGNCSASPAESSRAKRSSIRLSHRRHIRFFRHLTRNRAPYFLHRGMSLAYVNDSKAAPFRVTCLPAADPDGPRSQLRYSLRPVYPADRLSLGIGRSSGCVYVVNPLNRWPNLHPVYVCAQDCGFPAMRTCTTLLVILFSGRIHAIDTAAPLPESSTAAVQTSDSSTPVLPDVSTMVPLPGSSEDHGNSSSNLAGTTTAAATPAPVTEKVPDATSTDVSETTPSDLGSPDIPVVATASSSSSTDDAGVAESESTTAGTSPADIDSSPSSSPDTTASSPTVAPDLQTSIGADSSEPTSTTSAPAEATTAVSASNATMETTGTTGSASAGTDSVSTSATPGATTAGSSVDAGITNAPEADTTPQPPETSSASADNSIVSEETPSSTSEPLASTSATPEPALRFEQSLYEDSIPENVPINTRIPLPIRARVNGSDAAEVLVTYSLTTPGPDSLFDVDPLEGTLFTTAFIDREQTPQVNFSITARTPSGLTSTADVVIEVIDVNDNAPRFEAASYVVNVTADVEEGAALMTVRATDPDEGHNSEVTYHLSGGNSTFFSMDRHSGVLTLMARLPTEAEDYRFNLSLTVVDSGFLPLQSSVPLTVEVSPPSLELSSPLEVFLTQAGRPAGVEIGTLEARDRRAGNSSDVTFSLVAPQDGHIYPFSIDAETGVLVTTAPLPAGQFYPLTVEARVDGVPPRSVTRNIEVVVENPQ